MSNSTAIPAKEAAQRRIHELEQIAQGLKVEFGAESPNIAVALMNINAEKRALSRQFSIHESQASPTTTNNGNHQHRSSRS